jgi:DNA polymerase elongation subunit (family B)
MSDLLLGVSPNYLYYENQNITPVEKIHQPYFLAFKNTESETKAAKKQIQDLQQKNKDSIPWSYINRFGEVQEYDSFWHPSKKRHVFPIYVNQSFRVPEVSDYLFFNHNLFTAEHDIPYHQRVLVDIAAKNDQWIYDTHGKDQSVSMLVYDIEMSEFIPGKIDSPIDIIGFAAGNLSFQSSKNLETETFDFDFKHVPHVVDEDDIIQLVSRNEDEELDHLIQFCRTIPKYDIISGHNITGFDNKQVYGRVKKLLQDHQSSLSNKQQEPLLDFLQKYTRIDKSFHFGVGSDVVQIYPSGFDTYLAARKFYPNLESHSLKAVAPFLGYGVDDRLILTPEEITIDDTTLKYNRQDVIEQMGVSLQLIQLALPLAFTTGMPFETLLSAGAVNMWDHMALIRGAYNKKLMPATCRVNNIAKALTRDFHHISKRSDILKQAKENKEQLSKEFIRVVKYGPEMPEWMLYPYIIHNEQAKDADERSGYHMPGGMTIKPDKDADSHFIPWYKVVVADVGAMYPTILKAMNVGADTVQLCKKDETPDMWTWFKKLPKQFFRDQDVAWKPVNKEDDTFADKGYWVGVNIQKETGVVNGAMTGIMGMIAKIKQELQDVQQTGNAEEIKRLKMMYQSVKGARNAGTHGILAAPNVSGRQFNLWGACAITTKGQVILDDTLQMLKNKDIRVTYGDTDGLYLGCSRSIGKLPDFSKALGAKVTNEDDVEWLTSPDESIEAIKDCNEKWQRELNYPEFELEPEYHDAMVFVKHKNYLIFDEKNGIVEMATKGNNFKGSDKANIARKALKEIMINVLRDVSTWSDEDEARSLVKDSIRKHTQDVVASLDFSKVDIKDLTLIQSVKPAKSYKTNQDGGLSTFGKRAQALEKLLDVPIRSRMKFRFVVTKKSLPGIHNPSKSGVKPIDFMFPVDKLSDKKEIDLDWYKDMIENYIQGAFGLPKIGETQQTGLDSWM